jgi:tRNA1(Val) A37 N6-methylase TrmN6
MAAERGCGYQGWTFDVVVTNPPFGTKLKVPGVIGKQEGYDLARIMQRFDGYGALGAALV